MSTLAVKGKWVMKTRAKPWSLARLLDSYGHEFDLDTIYTYYTCRLTVVIPKMGRSKKWRQAGKHQPSAAVALNGWPFAFELVIDA